MAFFNPRDIGSNIGSNSVKKFRNYKNLKLRIPNVKLPLQKILLQR